MLEWRKTATTKQTDLQIGAQLSQKGKRLSEVCHLACVLKVKEADSSMRNSMCDSLCNRKFWRGGADHQYLHPEGVLIAKLECLKLIYSFQACC